MGGWPAFARARQVMVIFIYWLQIFTLFTVSEHASRSILPITRHRPPFCAGVHAGV